MREHPEMYGALLLYGIPAAAAALFWTGVRWVADQNAREGRA